MTADQLRRLTKPQLMEKVLELQNQVYDLQDELRGVHDSFDALDRAAMAYRECWRRHSRMEPQSSRDIPNN